MYAKYLGRDLYDKLNSLVGRAFYRIYTHAETNWYEIEEINIDYSTCEEDADLPFVKVVVNYNTIEGQSTITLEYSLEESDDFNVGRFYEKFDKEYWGD